MKERRFLIKVIDVDNDGSEFKLVLLNENNEVLESVDNLYSFGECLLESYNFYKMCFEKYNIDCRYDYVEVNLRYIL